MAIGDDIQGLDRTFLNVTIVVGTFALGLGVVYFATGWAIAKMALFVAIPIAALALFATLIRSWWPRDEV